MADFLSPPKFPKTSHECDYIVLHAMTRLDPASVEASFIPHAEYRKLPVEPGERDGYWRSA